MELAEIEARLRGVLERTPDLRFAYVFGSAVTRGPDRARDVDVAASFRDRPALFAWARLASALEDAVGKPVDLVDLDDATTLLRREVLTTGRVVAAPDARALADFRARVPLEYLDLEPHLVRQAEGLRRALAGPEP